ncbi:sigma factor [Pseudomonas aeruginosa]
MGMDQTRNRLVGLMFQNDYSWLSGRLRRYLGCPHSAEDIASETFLKVLALPDPASIREPRALLTTIARRLMYDGWRRQDLERAYLESLAGLPEALAPSAEEQAQVVETLLRLERMLAGLSPKTRRLTGPYAWGWWAMEVSALGVLYGWDDGVLRASPHYLGDLVDYARARGDA